MDPITHYLDELLGPLLNPQKRVFLGYLLSALLIALIAMVFVSRIGLRTAFTTIFDKSVWLSKSAKADYALLLINRLMTPGPVPRLLSALVVATLIFETLHVWMNGRISLWPETPAWTIAVLFTFTLFLVDDATKYLLHRAMHRWPVLWCFHAVHHSAEVLTPLTVYRTHPVESLLFSLRAALAQGITIALFIFFFGDRASLVSVLGANVFLFFFNIAGSNLRHSHIWISYGRTLEHWLISPAQHQIHHSLETRHHDRNFGAVLAVWDRLGRSLCIAEQAQKPSAFGIPGGTDHSLYALYFAPIARSLRILLGSRLRILRKAASRATEAEPRGVRQRSPAPSKKPSK